MGAVESDSATSSSATSSATQSSSPIRPARGGQWHDGDVSTSSFRATLSGTSSSTASASGTSGATTSSSAAPPHLGFKLF
eukprot:2302924-Pyramimonas_sp.AAC.1